MDTLQRRKIDRKVKKLHIIDGFMVQGSPETHLIVDKRPKIADINIPVVFLSVGGGNRSLNDLKLSNGSNWIRNFQRREVRLKGVLMRKHNVDMDEIDLSYYRRQRATTTTIDGKWEEHFTVNLFRLLAATHLSLLMPLVITLYDAPTTDHQHPSPASTTHHHHPPPSSPPPLTVTSTRHHHLHPRPIKTTDHRQPLTTTHQHHPPSPPITTTSHHHPTHHPPKLPYTITTLTTNYHPPTHLHHV